MAIGRAKLAIGRGLSVWVLEAPEGFGDAGFHTHHAIQLTISLSGDLALASRSSTITGKCIAVASDARHRFEAHGLIVFIFVEPESASGRALAQALFGGGDLVSLDSGDPDSAARLGRTFAEALSPEQLLDAGRDFVEALAATLPAMRLPDERIRKVIDYAAASLEPSLSAAAERSGVFLSPSRLRHLFVEQTGLAFRTYLLWLRLNRALEVYSSGRSLTEAAHAAGFADSAHLSRVFRRTFGLPATTLERV